MRSVGGRHAVGTTFPYDSMRPSSAEHRSGDNVDAKPMQMPN